MPDQRAYPRYPLSLDVTVNTAGSGTFFCTARDFCLGGMYLVFNTQFAPGTPTPEQLPSGTELTIDFTDPNAPEMGYHRLEAKVARADGIGFGVAFTSHNAAALQTLQQLTTRGSGGEAPRQARPEYRQLINELHSSIEAFSGELFDETLNAVDEGMLRLADSAANNAEQNHYFLVINTIKKERAAMRERFLAGLAERGKVLTEVVESKAIEPPPEKVRLSLIDKDEFNDWLILTTMISRNESNFTDELYALEHRLNAIGVTPLNKQNLPVGPYVICHTFQDSLKGLPLNQAQGELIYKLFDHKLRVRLERLYQLLNNRLIEAGIIPDISDEYEFVAPTYRSDARQEAPSAETPLMEGDETAANMDRGEPAAAAQQPPPVSPAARQTASMTAAAPQPSSNEGAGQPVGPVTIPGQGFTALSSLISYSRHTPTSRHGSEGTAGAIPPVTQQVDYYPSDQLLVGLDRLSAQHENISQLRHEGGSVVELLKQQLDKLAADDGRIRGIDEQQGESLQFVENLLDYFQSDQLISDLSKEWVAKLELPLLKGAILDPDILHNNRHPAHQVINRIDTIGSSLVHESEERRQELIDHVEALITWISREVDTNPNVFADALATLDEEDARQQALYDQSVNTIIAECERQQQLNQARAELVEELNLRIGDRDVARIVIALLDSGWKNLLLSTYLKRGADSELYQKHLDVLDQLNARLTGQAPFKESPAYSDNDCFSWVVQVMSKVAKDKERAKQLINTLKYLFKSDVKEVQRVHMPRLSTEQFQGKRGSGDDKPPEIGHGEWVRALEHAERLGRDELFEYHNDAGEKQIVKLIWLDKGFSRYIFVDRAGLKVLDVDINRLAQLLHDGQLTKVDEWDTPIMDRATFSLLDKLHQQFSAQASKDELTGLLNRRAFERHIDKLIAGRSDETAQHIFSYFDLDRFNLINNACGYTAGDTLLKQFAEILKDGFGEEAVVARVGDDEYGVLIEGSGRAQGLVLTNKILDTLHSFSFSCNDKDFAITASIGMVEFDQNYTSTSDLLQAAESACFSAKETGRDNIQVYNPENFHLAQRQNRMEWVGRINKLFDAGLIKLRCQKIAPLHPHVLDLPHYEILLDVYDEEGNHVPNEEFVAAAEYYNRINDIDHWVVNTVLDWIDVNHSKVRQRIGGFSINLSGSSLNDKKFMNRLHERMIDISFPAGLVTFEITETLAIKNIDNAARFITTLKETGCRFSLDDFGSGVSSYAYLKSLPVDYLKIDGIFVRDLATSTNDYAVIKSINEISHVMGKTTIAEFAEDEIIVQILRDIGIDYAQGFGIEKPKPLDSLIGI